MKKRCRRAFTLFQLLVVLAVLAILLALLLPAVQKVREAAARMQSQNNLKQIALACHMYNDTYQQLPRGGIASWDQNGPTWSFLALLLPFVEQSNLYTQCNIPTNYHDLAAHRGRRRTFG